jgi:hypothetical protein
MNPAPLQSRLRHAPLLAALGLLFAAPAALAGDTVGIGLGSATLSSGVSAKWHAKSGSGLQLVVGPWGIGPSNFGSSTLALNLDGIRDMPKIGNLGPVDVGWSLGGGAGVAFASSPTVAASFVAGLNLKLQPVPLELALEYRPVLWILPSIGGELLNASGHLRWWF